ncbi:heavy-metal-associated domain-containing protein [Mycetohabitans sp. B8]|uniref:heavy-metal-associated domain-containing protein n=1 Tax=Mycetohabitans sp. B8 TaxID=2841845 RepID=UPI001F1F1D79|nr:heavy-metal-associated domain-containing protein [Mycetohabitans sp. B8]MCG1042145.1 heavy-metal-associated domain-containing protein [Mycetohabitans sp. B8]
MIEFKVSGMNCQHCVKVITESLHAFDAHARVDVNLERGHVTVDSTQPRAALKAAIEDAGYTVNQ